MSKNAVEPFKIKNSTESRVVILATVEFLRARSRMGFLANRVKNGRRRLSFLENCGKINTRSAEVGSAKFTLGVFQCNL